jgi:serine/threonine-protein kinase PpkA
MIYEILLGKKPYLGKTELETVTNSIQNPIPRLPKYLEEFQPLLDSLLAKMPQDRLSDAKLVTRFITQYLKDHPQLAKISETQLIDTEVVVEYIAKNKIKKVAILTRIGNWFPLILTCFFVLILFFNQKLLWHFFDRSLHTIGTDVKVEIKPKMELNNKFDQQLGEASLAERNKKIQQREMKVIELDLQRKQELEKKQAKEREEEKVKEQQARLIARLMKKGEQALKKYRLTTPLSNNAMYFFNKVLILEENNKAAKKGIKQVVYHYYLLAKNEFEQYHYDIAQIYINKGLVIDKHNKSLIFLQKKVTLENDPDKIVNKVKNFFKNL